jgi:hypothetical protein
MPNSFAAGLIMASFITFIGNVGGYGGARAWAQW